MAGKCSRNDPDIRTLPILDPHGRKDHTMNEVATTPVARVPHRCYWCRELITAGERYSRVVTFDDGTAFTFKQHFDCEALYLRYARYWAVDEGDVAPEWERLVEFAEGEGIDVPDHTRPSTPSVPPQPTERTP